MEAKSKKYIGYGVAGLVLGGIAVVIWRAVKAKGAEAGASSTPEAPPLNASGRTQMLPTKAGGVWCNCANGKQCAGTWSGCPCCSGGALMAGKGKKLVANAASWNCINNPNAPGCKEPGVRASFFCQQNPNDSKCKEPIVRASTFGRN